MSAQRVPGFARTWILAIALCLALAVVVALWWGRWQNDRRVDFCARAVAEREDDRAMWVYLIDRNQDRQDDPEVVEFVAELDKRLPRLSCDDQNRPVPMLPKDLEEDS